MKLSSATLCFFMLLNSIFVHADGGGKPYVEDKKQFLEIDDVNRQAEAWSMCAAAYDIFAELISVSQPARSKQFKELSNGAETATTMSIVLKDLSPDITQERFNALWNMGKLAGSELPKTSQTTLLAEAEYYGKENSMVFLKNIAATIKVCAENSEAQRMYIDAWRELAKSGLLTSPN